MQPSICAVRLGSQQTRQASCSFPRACRRARCRRRPSASACPPLAPTALKVDVWLHSAYHRYARAEGVGDACVGAGAARCTRASPHRTHLRHTTTAHISTSSTHATRRAGALSHTSRGCCWLTVESTSTTTAAVVG